MEAWPTSGQEDSHAPPTSRHILLVDDDASFARALARLLHRDGYTLNTAPNGALALAQLHTQRYEVVLCDVLMPTLDGPAFYARLLQEHPSLGQRVIFLTGDSFGSQTRVFLESCGQPWLYKPCSAAAIRRAIQQVLRPMAP
jgi:CheY-like chemotaxis protein